MSDDRPGPAERTAQDEPVAVVDFMAMAFMLGLLALALVMMLAMTGR